MRAHHSSPLLRLVAALAVALALVVGAAACGGGGSDGAADTSTTAAAETTTSAAPSTTTTTADPNVATFATAKVASLTVLAQAPDGVDTAPTTTTTAPSGSHPPIPRVGLDSAGVSKVATGYQFDNPTYFGNPLTMQVVEQHGDWLKVLIQARPNHTEGWVRASDVSLSTTTYKMVLSLADRHVKVYDGADVVAETDVVIGKTTTPTPVGRFYLSEKIAQKNTGGAYGPWILSTNGYSEALDLFDNGLPVVAFHGTNQPQLIGTQASNGCIRMPNAVISQLADMLPAGTPIEIHTESFAALDAPVSAPGTATTIPAA